MLSKSHNNIRDPLFGLANKLGVGSIYTKNHGKILQMSVGSQVFFRYSFDTGDSEINLHKVVDLMVGTKAKTNRMKSI
jgi:hypothetical protein